jgi:uncharacterized protein (DUF885 family)
MFRKSVLRVLPTTVKLVGVFAVSFFATAFAWAAQNKNLPQATPEGAKLLAIIQEFTDAQKVNNPFYAAYFNREDDLKKFGDTAAPEFFDAEEKMAKKAFAGVQSIDPSGLSASERIACELFFEDLKSNVDLFKFDRRYLGFNQMDNQLTEYMYSADPKLTDFPFDSVKHFEDWITRSKGLEKYITSLIALHDQGIKRGIVHSCAVTARIPGSIKSGAEPDLKKNPFSGPIEILMSAKTKIKKSEKARLKKQLEDVVANQIVPQFSRFLSYYDSTYAPKCRKSFGLQDMPKQQAWYRSLIKARTGVDASADDLHKIGLGEVERIKTGMMEIQKELKIEGDFKSFLKMISTDETFFFKEKDELVRSFKTFAKSVDKVILQYFSVVPKSPLRLEMSPNPNDAAGSYRQPTESREVGLFVMNGSNLKGLPKYGVATLYAHEAIPGHHFQLARHYEMKTSMTDYQQKLFFSTAYIEGWALYAEYLGREMGIYKTPYDRLGNLSDEMLRAVRLVVDTGIHAKGWSREKVIDYMTAHLASEPVGIAIEADRYSVWPGQALGYKVGQLKIIELRKIAEQKLGAKFDIKQFHEVVIGNGTISLGVLERLVNQWVSSKR